MGVIFIFCCQRYKVLQSVNLDNHLVCVEVALNIVHRRLNISHIIEEFDNLNSLAFNRHLLKYLENGWSVSMLV